MGYQDDKSGEMNEITTKLEQGVKSAPTSAMPDPTITMEECRLFGYSSPGIVPLSEAKALELFDKEHAIYMLNPDNTELIVLERGEIMEHTGIFGIEVRDWEMSVEYQSLLASEKSGEVSKEADLLNGSESKFGIYQLKADDGTRDYRFESLDSLTRRGLSVDRANYELLYTAPLRIGDTLSNLNEIYEKFNIQRPDDFTGHSISVSDIIVLQLKGDISSHYVDSFGFKELPAFLGNGSQRSRVETSVDSVGSKTELNAGKQMSMLELGVGQETEGEGKTRGKVKSETAQKKPSILNQLNKAKKEQAQKNATQKPTPKKNKEQEV